MDGQDLGWDGKTDGGTFFSTWDGRDEDGIAADGSVPPGDDLIEDELKRLFNIDGELGDSNSLADMDDVRLMWKLRKELGDADFARIFEDQRIKGPDVK